jgi:hypothetical protein
MMMAERKQYEEKKEGHAKEKERKNSQQVTASSGRNQ